jgi:cysteine-rich repeat protein
MCDDGLAGTQGDQCDGAGACIGTPYACTPSQCQLSAVPDGVGCVVENASASVACDDDDLSTKLDVCDGFGGCAGQPYTCEAAQCEVSSTVNGQACDVVNAVTGSACDDGDLATTEDQCDGAGQCQGTPTVCGDEVTEGLEVCDDGNQITEQSCPYGTPNCTHCRAGCNEVLNLSGPYCGDDISQSEWGEECDDGNGVNGDGCSASCEGELGGCVVLGQDVRTLNQPASQWQQSSCQTLCEDNGGIIPQGFRVATSAEVKFLVTVLSFGSCAACGVGSCWWYGAPADELYDGPQVDYTCTSEGCSVAAPFCYTQMLLVREDKDGTCAI